MQVFGNSPDETAYCRLVLNKEPAAEALLGIQPTLMAYSLDGPVTPVLLDVSSIQPGSILVLDSYFYVVVFHGSTIAQWRKQRFQDQEEYASFKQLLEVGVLSAANIFLAKLRAGPAVADCRRCSLVNSYPELEIEQKVLRRHSRVEAVARE